MPATYFRYLIHTASVILYKHVNAQHAIMSQEKRARLPEEDQLLELLYYLIKVCLRKCVTLL